MKTHIGKIIKKHLEGSKMSVTDFAKEINKERSNVYDIFRRESIDTDLLIQIGKALNHNFFKYYVEEEKENLNEPKEIYSPQKKKSKIMIELELDDDDMMRMGIREKVLMALNK